MLGLKLKSSVSTGYNGSSVQLCMQMGLQVTGVSYLTDIVVTTGTTINVSPCICPTGYIAYRADVNAGTSKAGVHTAIMICGKKSINSAGGKPLLKLSTAAISAVCANSRSAIPVVKKGTTGAVNLNQGNTFPALYMCQQRMA